MTDLIDIKSFIDRRPVSAYQWLLVALCFCVVTADGVNVAIMGFIAPPILQEWHVSPAAFGVVMSAAPFGLVAGSLAAGPSSDRLGRKRVLVTSVFLFGLFTVAAAWARNPTEMAILRVLAGTGLGAAMPNALTLLAEYAPERRRSLLSTIMFTGFNLGSAAIGFAAAILIPHHGWRSVLFFGGAVSLVQVPGLILLLPESARLLALHGADPARIAKILGRVMGTRFPPAIRFMSPEPRLPRRGVGLLFSQGFGLTTISLWITCFMGLLVIYLFTGWLPTLMKRSGISISTAAEVTAMFQIGGTIGAIIVGYAMDRGRAALIIAIAYFGGGACILLLSSLGVLSPLVSAVTFCAGFCMSGAQTGLNAYAPAQYPTAARATGVSWMFGMGRFGSIWGSAVGGALMGLGWGFQGILAALAIPAACAGLAILLTQIGRRTVLPVEAPNG